MNINIPGNFQVIYSFRRSNLYATNDCVYMSEVDIDRSSKNFIANCNYLLSSQL